MRPILIISMILLLGDSSCGQRKDVFIPTLKNGDTSLWYKWQQEKYHMAGLPDLVSSGDNLHFRFASEIQALDIWTSDFKEFFGTLTNFTRSCNENSNPKSQKFFSSKSNIEKGIAKEIYNIFNKLLIFSIPPDDSLPGWRSGNDGKEYYIEYSTPMKYSFKTYWTPYVYKGQIKEAEQIDNLVEQLEALLKMKKCFVDFIYTLPHGTYMAGGVFVITNIKQEIKGSIAF